MGNTAVCSASVCCDVHLWFEHMITDCCTTRRRALLNTDISSFTQQELYIYAKEYVYLSFNYTMITI